MHAKGSRSSGTSLIAKVFTRQKEWDDKEELLDIIYWLRQFIAVLVGITWGSIPMTGAIGLLSFFAVSASVVYFYHAFFHRVDEEEFGGVWELVKEGMMTSFAMFLITWIMTYTLLQFG